MGRNAVIAFHRGCLDGRMAALLLAAHAAEYGLAVTGVVSLVYGESAVDRLLSYSIHGGTLFIGDFCPAGDDLKQLNALFDEVVVVDHHETAEPVIKKYARVPRMTMHYDMGHSGAGLVAALYPSQTAARVADAIVLAEEYDLWRNPRDRTFAFEMGARLLWRDLTGTAGTTTRHLEMFGRAVEDVEVVCKRGEPELEHLREAYRGLRPFELALDGPVPQTAVAALLDTRLNVSIIGHWLLRDFPHAVACIAVRGNGAHWPVSYRARSGFSLLRTVAGAKGHACAAGGTLPASAFENPNFIQKVARTQS